MNNLAVVGSGITGALTAYMIKQVLPHVKVTIIDKAKGVGGRMSTSRSPLNDDCIADLGAQYFSLTPSTNELTNVYHEKLLNASLLKPMDVVVEGMRSKEQKMKHYICTKGSGSVVRYFIENSGCETHFCERVVEVVRSSSNQNWTLKTENSIRDGFNGVVFTIPVPQIFQIQGISQIISDEHRHNLMEITYNSRLAIAMFYDKSMNFFDSIPWSMKYVDDNPVIRYISVDDKKRGVSSALPSIVIHTTQQFGKSHIDQDAKETQALVLDSLRKLIPNCPEPSHIKFHKWRYSQIEKPYPNRPGCIIAQYNPLFILGGDGFATSNFDGCLYSAEKIVESIVKSDALTLK